MAAEPAPQPAQNAGSGPAGAADRAFNFNTVLALVCIAGAVVLWLIIPDQIKNRTPAFLLGGFKPELFPRVVAAGLGLVGVWYFFASLRMREHNALADLTTSAVRNVTVTLLLALAYATTLGMGIGFVLPSFAFLFLLSTYLGNRNWWLGIGVNYVVAVAIYLIFRKVLLQSLPESPEVDFLYTLVVGLFN